MRLAVLLALAIGLHAGDPLPLKVSAANAGGWGDVDWWFVDVEPNGRVEVRPKATLQEVILDPEVMDELRGLVMEESVFGLEDRYGLLCVDCSYCKLTIELGETRKTIAVGSLHAVSDQEATDTARFLRVWNKVKTISGISDRPDACQRDPPPN